jgi:hypothetical protein
LKGLKGLKGLFGSILKVGEKFKFCSIADLILYDTN